MTTEEQLESHEERLTEHDKRLNIHSERIDQLVKFDEDKHRRLKKVEENYGELKETIVGENKEMRQFFQSNMDKQWDLIKSRDEQKHETRKMKHDLDKTKTERYTDIAIKLLGAGGIAYLVAQNLLGG